MMPLSSGSLTIVELTNDPHCALLQSLYGAILDGVVLDVLAVRPGDKIQKREPALLGQRRGTNR